MNHISKIKEYFRQTSKGERFTGAIGLLVGIGILVAQGMALGNGYLRYVTIAITAAYTVAALVSANELCSRLERVKNPENESLPKQKRSSQIGFSGWWTSFWARLEKTKEEPNTAAIPLSVLKARWKMRSEYMSVAALLGFGITQYRVALEIDNLIAQRNAANDPTFVWVMFQSIALIGLLMLATLVISRKLALAKFEYKEAVEKFEVDQREKVISEPQGAEHLT